MAAQQTCQRRCEHEKSIQKWKRNKIKTRGNESATEAKRRLKPRLRWWRWRWWSLGAEQVFKTCYKGVFKNLLISTPSPDGAPFSFARSSKVQICCRQWATENGAWEGAPKRLGAGSRRPPFNEARSAENVFVSLTAQEEISHDSVHIVQALSENVIYLFHFKPYRLRFQIISIKYSIKSIFVKWSLESKRKCIWNLNLIIRYIFQRFLLSNAASP